MDVIYSKYSNDRAIGYRIRTDISIDSNGDKTVYKRAMNKEDMVHIDRMYSNYLGLIECFEDTKVTPNITTKQNDGLEFEFVKGVTLEEILDECIESGDIDRFKELYKEYLELFYGKADKTFEQSEEYINRFGEFTLEGEYKSLPITDVDIIFANVFVDDDKWTLIDYEWTYDFLIPIKYVIYRTVYYYLVFGRDKNVSQYMDMFEMAGITEEEKEFFGHCEEHFQKSILEGNHSLWLINDNMGGKLFYPYEYGAFRKEYDNKRKGHIQILYKSGEVREFDYEPTINNELKCKYGFDIDASVVDKITILPFHDECSMQFECIVSVGNYGVAITDIEHNGQEAGEERYSFFEAPQFVIDKLQEGTTSIFWEYMVNELPKEELMRQAVLGDQKEEELEGLRNSIAGKDAELANCHAQIQAMQEELHSYNNTIGKRLVKKCKRKLKKSI